MVSTLCRLRADPNEVRVSVRRVGGHWECQFASRLDDAKRVSASHRTPAKALVRALQAAEAIRLRGIDIGMAWAYGHPQRRSSL